MTPQELLNKISTLSGEQQNAVEQFAVYLQERKPAQHRTFGPRLIPSWMSMPN